MSVSEHFVHFSFVVYILAVSVEAESPLGGAVGPREELSVCFHIEEVMKTSCEEEVEQSFLLMARKPATSSQEEDFLSSRLQNRIWYLAWNRKSFRAGGASHRTISWSSSWPTRPTATPEGGSVVTGGGGHQRNVRGRAGGVPASPSSPLIGREILKTRVTHKPIHTGPALPSGCVNRWGSPSHSPTSRMSRVVTSEAARPSWLEASTQIS
ncbi:hypothetical protein EYF80_049830 [Liparis tanakae]|uniref:Uncharacterized protein n=1 Tax=Liparis tanakae TaxID=230148 RepID=A0A4Z2FGC5_9TELE|nr:hypothetical protein EYF80_049830 [Liparis tanakae]